MALRFTDRVLTILVTATLTSAAWILVGSDSVRLPGESDVAGRAPASGEAEAPLGAQSGAPAYAGVRAARESNGDSDRGVRSGARNSGESGERLIIPVASVRAEDLSDSYSDARGEGERLHEATDIMAPAGTPVVAAAPGTVEKLFLSKAGGKTIYIRSPDGRRRYYYAHLDAYAPGIREGQQVRRGESLGTVGSSGNADPEGPHLHFAILRTSPDAEWWEPGSAINPYPLLGGR